MLPTVKERFVQFVDLIPGLRSRKKAMAEPPKFTATDNFQHRYAKMEVLREALIALGFKDEEIRIKVRLSTTDSE
jgi:hypothetical protein